MNAHTVVLIVVLALGYIVGQAVLEREVFDRLHRRRMKRSITR